jgi:hypothetical protein
LSAPRDEAFEAAYQLQVRYLAWRRAVEGAAGCARPSRAEFDRAATTMVDYWRKTADGPAAVFIVASAVECHRARIRLPDCFMTFFVECIANPRPVVRKRGNQGANLVERQMWRTDAATVQIFIAQGMSLDEACEAAAAWPASPRQVSGPTMKRHWQWAIAEQRKSSKSD